MKQLKPYLAIATLISFLTACPQTVTPPEPPVTPTPDPTTFPVTEISGTIPNWTVGEAYVTLVSGYSAGLMGDVEKIDIVPPAYQTTPSAAGAFTVQLGEPEASERLPLTCGGEPYPLGFLALAVVSNTPQPAQLSEVFGIYTLGPPDSIGQDAVWLYSEEALELDAACNLLGSEAAAKLKLVPGWNQAVLTFSTPVQLESAPVPESFIWSQY